MDVLNFLMPAITSHSRSTLFLCLLINFCVGLNSYASPHPGVGTSALVDPALGIFLGPQGFSLKTGASGWILGESTETLTYANPHSTTGSLSIRSENLRTELSLENYAKRWMKDYSSYGFDVLGTKTFTQGNARGLVIDLAHKKQGQQLRQVLFLKDKKAVILTCKDNLKSFEASLTGCNQITKTFEWAETANSSTHQKVF